jgi:hypothetical protein
MRYEMVSIEDIARGVSKGPDRKFILFSRRFLVLSTLFFWRYKYMIDNSGSKKDLQEIYVNLIYSIINN